jgi:hypothetical protein
VRPQAHNNSWVKVLTGGGSTSVAEGNCVTERWGGEQPEANDQPAIKKMMNSIRLQTTASLLGKGEAREVQVPPATGGQEKHQFPILRARVGKESAGMVGGRTVRSCGGVKRGSRTKGGAAFMAQEPEEPRLGGDRALVVAKKSVMRMESRRAGRQWPEEIDRQKKKIGIVPSRAVRVEAKASGWKSFRSDHTLCNGVAQHKDYSDPRLTVKVSVKHDSQLESRMREIRLSGSGGGAGQ